MANANMSSIINYQCIIFQIFIWRIPNSLKDSNVSLSRKQQKKEELEHVP
jgi:hypothetical protein